MSNPDIHKWGHVTSSSRVPWGHVGGCWGHSCPLEHHQQPAGCCSQSEMEPLHPWWPAAPTRNTCTSPCVTPINSCRPVSYLVSHLSISCAPVCQLCVTHVSSCTAVRLMRVTSVSRCTYVCQCCVTYGSGCTTVCQPCVTSVNSCTRVCQPCVIYVNICPYT